MRVLAAIVLSFCLASTVPGHAEVLKYQATPVNIPGMSAEFGIISPAGAVAGVMYAPERQVFVQRGTQTQIIPLSGAMYCTPRAANEVNGRTVVAGTCGFDTTSIWYWDGSSVRMFAQSSPYANVSGVSAAGIVAGNLFPPGAPTNPATLWNGTDGSMLPINGPIFGQYTMGISNSGLTGLSPQPATYDIKGDRVTNLGVPTGYTTGGSNQFTMASDGTFAGTLQASFNPSTERIFIWRNGSLVRDLPAPPGCTGIGNYIDWVSATLDGKIFTLCRTDFPSTQRRVFVATPTMAFKELRSIVSGLPASGELIVSRHVSSSGVLVGQVSGDARLWRITPPGAIAARDTLTICADARC